MKICEFYQEEPGGTFTHAGTEYLLNPLLKFTETFPVINIPVSKLDWVITDPTEESEYADTSVPILVTQWEGKLVVIDGYHRLLKAHKHNIKTIPAKIVSDRFLRYFIDRR
jgi:hypothetical protein